MSVRIHVPAFSGSRLKFERWFAVQVIPRQEERIASMLEYKGYEQFVPLCRSELQIRNGMKPQPLFPGYIFCRMRSSITGLMVTTPGVIRILSNGGSPVFVDSCEMRDLFRITNCDVAVESHSCVSAGSLVRIIDGPLNGLAGNLVKVRNQRKLAVSVSLLSRSVIVEIDRFKIQPISGDPKPATGSARLLA